MESFLYCFSSRAAVRRFKGELTLCSIREAVNRRFINTLDHLDHTVHTVKNSDIARHLLKMDVWKFFNFWIIEIK